MAKLGRPDTGSLVTVGWLKQEFDKLHSENKLILNRINDLEKALTGTPNSPVTPELWNQVVQVGKLVNKLDQKVPDKNVPPSTGTGSPPRR